MCVAKPSDDMDSNKIGMNRCVRQNCRVKFGDLVTIKLVPDIPNHTRVHILPFQDTIEGMTGNIVDLFIKPYFNESY